MAAVGVRTGEVRASEALSASAPAGVAASSVVQAGRWSPGQRTLRRATHTVSVIVPTKDRPLWLAEALASIQRVADRLHGRAAFEQLVIDDGDTPSTLSVTLEAGARYLRSHGHGVSAARNSGLRAATGDLIAFLDDDDVWTGPQVAAQLDALEADPTLGAAFGQVIPVDADLHPEGEPWPDGPLPSCDARLFFTEHVVRLGALLVRRTAAQQAGGFDERLASSEDWDWLLRLSRVSRVAGVARPVMLFRRHLDPLRQDLDERRRRQRSDAMVVQRIRNHHLRGHGSRLDRLRWRLGVVGPLGHDTGATLGQALVCLAHGHVDRAAAWVSVAWRISPLYAARLSVGQPCLWRATAQAAAQAALAGLAPATPQRDAEARPRDLPLPAV